MATVDVIDEAVIDAFLGSETTVGRDDNRVVGLDHDALRNVMRQ